MASEPKLYELGAELEAIIAAIVEAGGELSPELEARLTEAEGAFAIKTEKLIMAIRANQARAKMIDSEIERLKDLAAPYHRTADSIKAYLFGQMQRTGKTKIDMPLGKAWIQKNSRPSIRYVGVDPEEMSDLPMEMVRITFALNGEATYQAWKDGLLPDELEAEVGHHLRVK